MCLRNHSVQKRIEKLSSIYNFNLRFMGYFITNHGNKNLKNEINELIKISSEIKILVGFFYFSGFKELYDGLKDNPEIKLKILVGLNVDKTNAGLLEVAFESNSNLKEDFIKSLERSFSDPKYDEEGYQKFVELYLELLRNQRIEIRKTREPNHAKLYIFKFKNKRPIEKAFITGSSNLTQYGLNDQHEFNIQISDFGTEEAEEYFDKLWEYAKRIETSNIIETIENRTPLKKITPFMAYAYILKSYLESFEKKDLSNALIKIMEKNHYKRYEYQLDAIRQALAIIEQYNGVLIADVVGLGKSVIASAIAFELKKSGIVISPPALMGDEEGKSGWRKFLNDFNLYGWHVYSLGDLENVLNIIKNNKEIEVIILDEAHRFRNENTRSYELIKNICRNKIVILLTATPFNNKPQDIFSLLKLFLTPKKNLLTLNEDLDNLILNYNDEKDSEVLARKIRNLIEPVTIRRNRLDLLNHPQYKNEIEELSRVKDPEECFFALTKEQSKFYDLILEQYFNISYMENIKQFTGALYVPFQYEKGIFTQTEQNELNEEENFEFQHQKNLLLFLRRVIVKRFESSFGAFQKTIEKLLEFHEQALKFIKDKQVYVLNRKFIEQYQSMDEDEIYSLLNFEESDDNKSKVYNLDKNFKNKQQFLIDIESDIKLLKEILKQLEELDLMKHDPKSETLINKIKSILSQSKENEPKRKVIIFSEYIDTVSYLEKPLRQAFRDRVLSIKGQLKSRDIEEIYKNFDASYYPQEDQYDILLTTDKISEGFNLNRAGAVINYDIPWNPVRVIQRVGRINRISKKVFDELYIYNFFPTERGSNETRSREIASKKMFLIHNILGEDVKLFDISEQPTASNLYKKIQENPDQMEKESIYTKIVKEYNDIKEKYNSMISKMEYFPHHLKLAKTSNQDELIVFFKKGRIFLLGMDYATNTIEELTLEEVIDKIKCEPNEERLDLSENFWRHYKEIKTFKKYSDKSKYIVKNAIEILTSIQFNQDQNFRTIQENFKEFLRDLILDLKQYGTLPEYTIRRIVKQCKNKTQKEIQQFLEELKQELGENYLQYEQERWKDISKEIIIAIEGRSSL